MDSRFYFLIGAVALGSVLLLLLFSYQALSPWALIGTGQDVPSDQFERTVADMRCFHGPIVRYVSVNSTAGYLTDQYTEVDPDECDQGRDSGNSTQPYGRYDIIRIAAGDIVDTNPTYYPVYTLLNGTRYSFGEAEIESKIDALQQ